MRKSLIYACTTALCAAISPKAYADIDFETVNDGYTGIGVYDCWEASPFRTNTLTGNFAIVDNPDQTIDQAFGAPLNPSEKVLGAQRSRYGSNLFGVRIDLSEKIQLSAQTQYVHIMVHRPVEGRVALVGLGKRIDRTDQTGEEEQFWVLSINDVDPDKWSDAVFGIKGSDNVQIHSLVLVPECESPHARTEDFLFYIDDITVNNDIKPRNSLDFYSINYGKNTTLDRSDRYLSSVTLTSPAFGTQKVNVNQSSDKKLYKYIPDTYFRVKAGETVSMTSDWSGSWMNAYVYLDRDNNGEFEAGVLSNGYTPDPTTDLFSFSFLSTTSEQVGYNSAGTYLSGNNRDTRSIPSFTIPADLKAGVYRMRFKIDWNDIDPNGSLATGNTIVSNGGAITDIIVVVSDGSKVNVRANQLNGDVTSEDGELLNDYKTNFGEPLKVKMAPAPGFSYSGMKVRHGVLTGDSLYHDNPQYREIRYTFDQFDENDCITLPAEVIDGDVLIEGFFVEEGSTPRRATVTYNLEYNGKVIATKEIATSTGNPYPAVEWDTETSSEFYEIEGIPEGEVEGDATIALTLIHKLPFEVSEDFNNAHWYNLTLTSDKVYLTHNPSANYISLTNPTRPASTDYNSQWCFVGDAFGGFKIFNRGAGESMILSSSHNTSANTGGSTYPVCTAHPVADGNNTYWIPTISSHLANGFYLHQIGYVNNKMNSRDERLAYWTGGYGAGSTFVATYVGSTSGIEDILTGDEDNTPSAYYNLQGIRVNANDLKPGIYICVKGNKATKVLIR